MSKETWIIAANSTYARIFKLGNRLKLDEMTALVHPESRMHLDEFLENPPGKRLGEARFGTSYYPTEQETSPKKVEAIVFAKQVSDHIENARSNGQIKRIYIAASPSFLGLLRQELSQPVLDLIAGEVSKDITSLEPEEIKTYFPIGI
ncbi:MAG TPA: host attachment protein [Waddliaceae bacterium]